MTGVFKWLAKQGLDNITHHKPINQSDMDKLKATNVMRRAVIETTIIILLPWEGSVVVVVVPQNENPRHEPTILTSG